MSAGRGLRRAGWMVMVWSLLYALTRNALGLMLLRVRGDTAKEVKLFALRHQMAVLRWLWGARTWPLALTWSFRWLVRIR
ncbi:hypothetical protein Franean1_0484 [Parafrankia sp. EAN1pec]|nr:hypothetical protein Franean1_0484 [Frankia sp. EAN1pec]